MNINKFLQSEKYSKLITTLGILLAVLVIFGAGVFVGYRKADFSYRWSDNYYRDFGGPHSPFAPTGTSDADDNAPTPHGAFGTVIGVNLPNFAVKGPNEAEKVIVIGPQTVIRSMHNLGTTTDIKMGQSVIIIGEPDDQGQINASFVRIMPPPPPSSYPTSPPTTSSASSAPTAP
jgi:hypothetical protein